MNRKVFESILMSGAVLGCAGHETLPATKGELPTGGTGVWGDCHPAQTTY